MSFPIITAHAGCAGTKSNTLYSVEMGIRAGADILEVDVRNTRDKVVVLYHDDYINKDKTLVISELNYSEVVRLEPSITKLSEVLNLIKKHEKVVNLDVKTLECVSEMLVEVKKADMCSNAIITGLKKSMISSIKGWEYKLPIVMSAEENIDFSKISYIEYARNTCHDALALGCSGINIDYRECKKELVEYAKLRCLPIFVWTVDSENDMEMCIDMGVASITTHNIDMLKNLYNKGEK